VALAAALAAALAGCAPPSDRAAGAPPVLYVATSVEGTVAQLDGSSGWPLGPPLPAGELPWQLARGRDGSLLTLSAAPAAAWPLTRLARAGGGWATRPLPWPGPTREARLAGAGGRYAVVVDRVPAPGPAAVAPRCRLTLVDVPAGGVASTAVGCGPRDLVTGLALDDGPGGPVAYLALWGRPGPPGAPPGEAGEAGGVSRVIAVDAQTGVIVAALPLDGVPVLVALGPAPGRLGHRLYAVERLSGPEDDLSAPPRARLLGLHPATLDLESERPLDVVPTRLVVAPDGDAAYTLHEHALTRVDLAGGADRRLAYLPARGLALAVVGDRVYVSSAYGPELWAVRRRDGRLVATLPVGRYAIDLLTSPAG
jgi:hypothetical protein